MSSESNRPNQENREEFEIKIEVGKDVADGTYSNLVIINHSPSEFILDFTTLLPGVSVAQVHSRIIMTPTHAKSLMLALQDNISKFEKSFGTIPVSNGGNQSNFLGNSNIHFN